MELLTPSCKTDLDTIKATKLIMDAFHQLKQSLFELVYAFNLLEPVAVEEDIPISTDWTHLFFHPNQVLTLYSKSRFIEIKYQILHIVMHGIMLDFVYENNRKDRELSNAISDLRANNLCFKLGFTGSNSYRTEAMNSFEYNLCSPKRGSYSNYIALSKSQNQKRILKYEAPQIRCDDHKLWNINESVKEQWVTVVREITETAALDYRHDSEQPLSDESHLIATIEDWCSHLQEGRSHKFDSMAGSAAQQIIAAPETNREYRSFLRQFLKDTYTEKEASDSIDLMLYSYGEELNEGSPLIEPNECNECPGLNAIAIAIDVSGSCSGEVAGKFLREVGHLLRDINGQLGAGCIYLFTCDSEIQFEAKMDAGDLAHFPCRVMNLSGWGGTSFVPVFDRIQKIEEELQCPFDCLIYLTDGDGLYPAEKPSYPVFFIMEHDYKNSPYWIQVLTMEE